MNSNSTTLESSCRRIFLKDYEVLAYIGAHDFEKNTTQRLIFYVELFVPYTQSTPSNDDLSEVVDYDFVRKVISERITAGHIELQETLCDDLMAKLINHPKIQAVRLSSCKPDVYPDCAGVGVEVFKMKDSPV